LTRRGTVTRFGSGTVRTWGRADMNDSVSPEGHPPCVTYVMNKRDPVTVVGAVCVKG